MPDLTFKIEGAQAVPFAAIPTIAFRVRVESLDRQPIQSIALRSQIMIEASKKRYKMDERDKLRDLFGEPERWSQTVRSLLWTHASATVHQFSGSVEIELPVSCTFDFNVGATKYFHAVEDDELPLCFQFSGTVFYSNSEGNLQIDQIGWDKEAKYRLSAKTWRDMMDHYYPNGAWLRLHRDAFEMLYEYKRRQGLATWEEAIESLVRLEREVVS